MLIPIKGVAAPARCDPSGELASKGWPRARAAFSQRSGSTPYTEILRVEVYPMLRSIISFSLAVLSAMVLMAAPASADPQYPQTQSDFTRVQYYHDGSRPNWNERTCCRRNERGGYRIFWSTVGECYQTRGERTSNKECRKSGGFHPYPGGHGGGYPGSNWSDTDWNERVCCTRDGHVWWATRGDCRWYRGQATANKVCRRN
jgi:hypothetical protein